MNEFDALKKRALEKYFGGLNEMQKKAVFKTEGPLLILAGAGSGKTTVLINRIADMIYFGDAYHYNDVYMHTQQELDFLRAFADGETDDSETLSDITAHNRINPWNILAITFTNKAANELKSRLENMLGEQGTFVAAATFHSICARILRRECANLGYKPAFTIYDTDDCVRLIKAILRDMDISDKMFPPKMVLSQISAQKNAMVTPEEFYETYKNDYRMSQIAKIFAQYNKRLFDANAMDFDDILLNTVKLFIEFEDVLEHYQNLYKYILVDEYQDTNTVQFRLIDLLSAKHGNLCVVGDDDQSIYKFRGATIENILSFEKLFGCDPETDVIKLEQNYRSTQNILTSANKLIDNNKGRKKKTLWSELGDGEKIDIFNAFNERTEAKYICEKISENVKNGMSYRQHAVLYRTNAQSNIIEQTLVREGIPYMVYGGLKFYDRKEIKDILAYLSVINNPSDMLRLRRIINEPKRGIGEATILAIEHISSDLGIDPLEVIREASDYAPIAKKSKNLLVVTRIFDELIEYAKEHKPSELLDKVVDVSGYGEMLQAQGDEGTLRLENIAELKSTMLTYEENTEDPNLEGFLEEVSLYTDIDKYDPDSDFVSLMTIHSAKGLEFDQVFLPGLEENVFPSSRSSENPEDIEEERRLAYVALTRAKRKLYISHAMSRMLFGRTNSNRPSRFLKELPEECVEQIKEQSPFDRKTRERPKRPDYSSECSDMLERRKNSMSMRSETADYKPGDVVIHPNPKFGRGIIISCEPIGKETMIEITFESCGTKKFFASTAKLKKV
ncbi:MAG: ATP-dependent helicase [Oscillospiraceae bacterium]